MPETTGRQSAPEDFTSLLARVNEFGQIEFADINRQLAEQAETIRMIAQATEYQEAEHVVTFFSA